MQKLLVNKMLQKLKKNISIEGEVTWKIKAASFFIEHVYYAAE